MAIKVLKKINLVKMGKNAVRFALLMAGQHWKKYLLPKHFLPGAGNIYKYHPRTAKYIKRKQRKYGRVEPLVYSGKTQRAMLGDQRPPIASLNKVTVKLPADRYIHMKRKTWDGRSLAEEVTATTQGEVRDLKKIVKDSIVSSMNQQKTTASVQSQLEEQQEGISLG